MNEANPSTAVGNGRGPGGRFGPGNKAGRGNPNNAKAQKIRNALIRAVDLGDIRAAVQKLMEQAKGGDVRALSEILDRCIGKPVAGDLLERIEALEQAMN